MDLIRINLSEQIRLLILYVSLKSFAVEPIRFIPRLFMLIDINIDSTEENVFDSLFTMSLVPFGTNTNFRIGQLLHQKKW